MVRQPVRRLHRGGDALGDVPAPGAHQGSFTYSLYCNICRSLFEKDKLLFAFCSAPHHGRAGPIDASEWLFLLTGGLGSGVNVARPWVDATKCWNNSRVFRLAFRASRSRRRLARVVEGCVRSRLAADPGVAGSLDQAGRVPEALVSCIRPDKVVPAVFEFVNTNKTKYVTPPPFNLRAC